MALKEVNFEILEQIAAIVGEENAYEICLLFAGEQVVFPKGIIKAKRDFDIRKEYKNGADYRALSIKHDLTTRQIRKICHPEKDELELEGQLELFEVLSP